MDDEILKVSVIENLKDAWRNIESTDLEFVKQESLDFCKNQVIKNSIMESVDLLEQKKYAGSNISLMVCINLLSDNKDDIIFD